MFIDKLKKIFKQIIDKVSLFSNPVLRDLPQQLSKSTVINFGLKDKVTKILLELLYEEREPFGMIVVLGWDNAWNDKYASILDSDQNIFSSNGVDIQKLTDNEIISELKKTKNFDGAILVSRDGKILASGIYLENMKPKEAAAHIGVKRGKDLSEIFGFSRKVHTRHLNAIAASYWLFGTTVYVISEEDGSMRIFENGKILWSYPYESEWRKS